MKQLIKIVSSVLLILFVSGCTGPNGIGLGSTPDVDENLQIVDSGSLKTISDMNAVAFEWGRIDSPNANGYYIYRSLMQKDAKLTRVATIKNKYVTHYVDENLEPDSQYLYSFSTRGENGKESRQTPVLTVATLPRLESVSYITAISDLPRQIKVLWRPHDNQRIKSYILEKTDPSTAKWRTVATINGRLNVEYIDDDLEDNQVFSYRLYAVTFDGIKSKPSQIIKAKTKPLPKGINLLKATQDLPRKIEITWGPSETEDVTAYKIYASSSANGYYKEIAKVNADVLNYTHIVNEDGKAIFYKISSLDIDGLETDLEMFNPVMGATLAKPNKPIMTLAQIQGEKAILNWLSGDPRTVSYTINKTIQESWLKSTTSTIKGIKALRYEDPDIVRGVTYKYSIQAVDQYGITSEITKDAELVLPKLEELE